MVALKPPTLTKLYIGNHIVNARYNYSLIQERIFNFVIFQSQEYIKQVKDGKAVEQLDIFNEVNNSDNIRIRIPLKNIGRHEEYEHIRDSMQKMCAIIIQTPHIDKSGKHWKKWQGLFTSVYEPAEMQRSGYMIAEIDKSVAAMLVQLQRRPDGTPINFSTFMYEVTKNARNKYTPRLYKLISSWQVKGGFYYSIEDLREYLQLGSRYRDTNALRTRILKPVSDELKENADCWFNVSDATFEEKDGKKVTGFNFKVISVKNSLNYKTQIDYLIYTFKTEYKCDNSQIELLKPIFEDTTLWDSLNWKMQKVNQKLKEDKTIHNVAAYVVKSVLNHFK